MQAFSVDAKDRPIETWANPACGSIGWQTLISRGLTDSSSMVCGIAILTPGMDFAAHHHAEAEIYFGLDGLGTVVIDGVPHLLAPGVALFIPPHAIHGVPPVSEALRFFYVFATDSFDDITYHFRPEVHPFTADEICITDVSGNAASI